MTTFQLYRIVLKSKDGPRVYARFPLRDGWPIAWTSDRRRADRWLSGNALEILCSLRREHKPARLERCDETIPD